MTSGWSLCLCHWRITQHWRDWVWRYVWLRITLDCSIIKKIEGVRCSAWSDECRCDLWGIGEQQDIGKAVFDCECAFRKFHILTEIDAENRTSALEQLLMPLPKLYHNHRCGSLISRFERNIPVTATWFNILRKGMCRHLFGITKFL